MATNAPKESPPMYKPEPISRKQATLTLFAKVFTEWERRYREDPEGFMSEATKLLKETPKTYGDACAPYFIELIDEISSDKG